MKPYFHFPYFCFFGQFLLYVGFLASCLLLLTFQCRPHCRMRKPAVHSVHALICTVPASSTQSGEEEGMDRGWRGGQTRLAHRPTVHPTPCLAGGQHNQMPVRCYSSYFCAVCTSTHLASLKGPCFISVASPRSVLHAVCHVFLVCSSKAIICVSQTLMSAC